MDRVPLSTRHRPAPATRAGVLAVACCAAWLASTAAAERPGSWAEGLRKVAEAQEWTDAAVRHEWRLQRRADGRSWRLLDPHDRIDCGGSEAACRAAWQEAVRSGRIPPVTAPTVILLHGLGEGRDSMQPLASHLRGTLDATVVTFGYASTRADIDAHGQALADVVADLDTAPRISFVGHSLGNLVVRRWMALAGENDLARVGRMVMLGPPNQGSDLARLVSRFSWVADQARGAARDLVVDWPAVAPRLAEPPCPFGIVAGGRGDDAGFSPILAGDDDAIVRVAETRLPGADDFLLVPVHHAAMMRHPEVQRATTHFLRTGRFTVDGAEHAVEGDE